MINNAYFSYDIAIILCQFLIFFAQIQIHLAYLFTLYKTKTSIGDIYKNRNVNVKGKHSAKNNQQSTQLIKNSSNCFLMNTA